MARFRFALALWCGLSGGTAGAATAPAVPVSVVDAESGAPVAGALVIYRLTAEEGTLTGHGGKTAVVRLQEVQTNAMGHTIIDAGEFERWPFLGNSHWSMPKLLVFKRGYVPETVDWSYGQMLPVLKDILEWPQAPRPVELKKSTTSTNLSDQLRWFGDDLERLYDWSVRAQDKCNWRKIPRVIVALEDEVMRLETSGARTEYQTTPLRNLLYGGDRSCTSAITFFQSYAATCPGSDDMMENFVRRMVPSVINPTPDLITQGFCSKTGQWWIGGERGWRAVPAPRY